jgi:hypothetical protein
LKENRDDGYSAEGMDPATIQAYADDMIIFSGTEEGLQRQVNRAKAFFDFAKC